jgi:endonuclease/exonuclease/phosphatase family metal-dependent hydrolase
MRSALVAAAVACLISATADANELRIGTWNIANLHHEEGVPLRDGAQPRDAEDYGRLRAFAASLNLDIAALQEIGAPRALARVFPDTEYHLVMSGLYRPGDEDRPASERDIYTAFAIRKATFPAIPKIESVPALALVHVGIDRDGKASNRPTRDGMVMDLKIGDRDVRMLNVHLKSFCHAHSLNPVFDMSKNGRVNSNRYDCRTLAAQAMILENWIEQQVELGRSVVVLGDFNRQFNRAGSARRPDHFWGLINDGTPNGLQLRKGPSGKNTTCWPRPHELFHDEHIEFVIFDASLARSIKEASISKVALPHHADPKYAGKKGEKLSDHCPVVFQVRN